ncbi:branched-chain amino acid ABC transporter permease [Cupriavidus basilensis]|uniref:branched-chain amino acid ABC transporter permease n=1 Tax=Cupriavidus basilensis TaxID=68895 RepID=UPI0023E8BD66|nr:branched-chain amino acid ABC transporter permease [Cupriavidus basilensis]MDF3884435.1 branched-chain amino acid ABC transporter permease [Cupriavidus basilensis]
MEYLIVSLLNGAIYGLLLFMVSAGLTLIFGMMGVLNFAHASFYMLGAYFAYTLQGAIGFWPAIVVSPILVGLVGVAVERFFLRRVHHHGHAHELLLTFGLSFIVAELIKLFFGNFPVDYRIPASLDFAAFQLGVSSYPFYRVFMGGIAVAMFAVIYLLLTYTRVGIVVRSAIYKPRMAEALGHNVPLVFMGVFGIGAALAGLAGAVAGAFYTTNPNMALELGVMVFVVVVVGGLGSLEGAMLASLLIGLITAFSVGIDRSLADLLALFGAGAWAGEAGGLLTLKLSSLAGTIPFALMLLILLVRPSGLMGEKE